MSSIYLDFTHRLGGVLTDADFVVFSNRAATFGLKELTSGSILIPVGTAWTKISTGTYRFDIGSYDITPDKTYEFWIAVSYDNEQTYIQKFITKTGTYDSAPEVEAPAGALTLCDLASQEPICLDVDSQIFKRMTVKPSIASGAVIEWILDPMFTDPEPYSYQLQWGQTDSHDADDWEDVGLPAEDVFYLIDTEQRAWGSIQRTYYRVKLTTLLGEYYSPPQHCLGSLRTPHWRLYNNRLRIWRLQLARTIRGQHGYLLKRRVHGVLPTPEQKIMDWQTDEVIDAQNEDTFGTEYIGGYYKPVCCYADMDNFAKFEHIAQNRGTVNDGSRISAIFVATPMLDSGDVWVSSGNDLRWRVWAVQHIEEINGVPIALKAELRLLPFSHISYKIPV